MAVIYLFYLFYRRVVDMQKNGIDRSHRFLLKVGWGKHADNFYLR
jgi:hypothetical protein